MENRSRMRLHPGEGATALRGVTPSSPSHERPAARVITPLVSCNPSSASMHMMRYHAILPGASVPKSLDSVRFSARGSGAITSCRPLWLQASTLMVVTPLPPLLLLPAGYNASTPYSFDTATGLKVMSLKSSSSRRLLAIHSPSLQCSKGPETGNPAAAVVLVVVFVNRSSVRSFMKQ
nr:hypothetical protein CFP56_63783 [Quercus suber]